MEEPTYDQVTERVEQLVHQKRRSFVKTPEIIEQFPEVSGRTVRQRLNELAERSTIEKTVVGANAAVWWFEDHADEREIAAKPLSESQ